MAPDASTFITYAATAEITTTNVATWTAYISSTGALSASATASATLWVRPFQPSITFTKTVGTDPSLCANHAAGDCSQGTAVVYCYTVYNAGNAPLSTHDLVDTVLGVITNTYAYTLAPGATTFITHGYTVNITTTNVATWTAWLDDHRAVTGVSSATVNVIPLRGAIVLTKTVGVNPAECAAANELTVMEGAPVYYCYTSTTSATLPSRSTTWPIARSVRCSWRMRIPWRQAPPPS